ncbi:tellurium resistance protein [Sinisalibacter lacisalsi]|uniref:Tellurium resistance protein n=1 Tax=Sinisalibacter lacisalsi TaxID=1526570 RepID=A0ABQ1QMS3_9RHOB|nr:tellurium resistance protein [Sinisalibacter lacisalsi]GGD33408.1 tellurium resistance protein [Sinisalibacter lacisalsi]
MAAQPPAFQAQKNIPRWRKTPPAIFPPILGLFGLAMAWGRAPDAFGISGAVGQVLMGAVTLLFLYALGNYLAKIAARPGVVLEDLKVLPGRAGLAAMTMALMLLAVAVLPRSEALARAVLALGFAGHVIVMGLIVWALLTGPAEARTVTPVFHLTFVGFIVSPFAALPLGWTGLATAVFWATLAAAVLIWIASAVQFARREVPAPLRPLLAIHTAPSSLLATVALLLGHGALGFGLAIWSMVLVAALVLRARWMIAAGFSPLWGAITFPLAAFASLMMVLGAAGYGEGFRLLGALALVAASGFIPYVVVKVGQMWLKGALGPKTNAAVA